jgi:serine protease AprX
MESNMKKRVPKILVVALLIAGAFSAASAATLSKTLQSKLSGAADDLKVGIVIVAFNTNSGLNDSHLAVLRSVGILNGITLQHLGMVAMPATAAQVRALAANPAVRSRVP